MNYENLNDGPDGTIPVPDAIDYAGNWRTYLAASGQDFVTRSFLIPIVSFQNILLYNPEAEGVRAYIGLEDATDPTTAKLLLVPVVDGQDVLVITPVAEGGLGGDGQSNIYDLTQACPPTCGVGSDLDS